MKIFLNSPNNILKCQFGNIMINITNDKYAIGYAVGKSKTDGDIEDFTKDMPYILDLAFYRYEL